MRTCLNILFVYFFLILLIGCEKEFNSSSQLSEMSQTEDEGISDYNTVVTDTAVTDTAVTDTAVTDTAITPTNEMVSFRDLSYSLPSGVESQLATFDIFRIDDGQVRPLVLLVHGGSWVSGDKSGFEPKLVPWWLAQGYVAAPVNFRLSSPIQEPALVQPRDQARDIAAALATIVSQAETYQIDPQKIILLGYSSGAHLVALLGTDERILREAGLNETQVKAVISLDVHAYDVPYALELMIGSVVEENIPLIKHLFGMTESEQQEGSPIQYVDGWAANALVISVDEDPDVSGTHGYIVSETAKHYIEALQDAGHQAETFHDRSENHSSLVGGFGAPNDLVTNKIALYLETLNLF